MKKETWINIGLALLVLTIIMLLAASDTFAAITDTILGVITLTLMIGLSIYKLALWFRYRNDPEKRERVVYSFQSFPKELRRWFLGESKAKEKQR
jgi:uncharacterized membrane-anchored protein